MKVRFHTPHKDGEGCATPKPAKLTAAIAALDGKVMDVEEGAALLKSSAVPCAATIRRDFIMIDMDSRDHLTASPNIRKWGYRAILFDEVKEGEE